MRENLDSVIKADQYAQSVDYIGIVEKTTEQLIKKIRSVFRCIRETGLKQAIEKSHFGVTKVEFLGRTITPNGRPESQKFSLQSSLPEIKKESPKL